MPNTSYLKQTLLAISVSAASVGLTPVFAESSTQQNTANQTEWSLKLVAGSLAKSINSLARQTGITLSAEPTLLKDISAPALSGI